MDKKQGLANRDPQGRGVGLGRSHHEAVFGQVDLFRRAICFQQNMSANDRPCHVRNSPPWPGSISPFGGGKDVKKTQPLAVKIASRGTSYSLLIFHFSEQEKNYI